MSWLKVLQKGFDNVQRFNTYSNQGLTQLGSGHGTPIIVKSDSIGFHAIGWWVWGIFPAKDRNKSKMGCGNREEREREGGGQENLRFFTAILGNKW